MRIITDLRVVTDFCTVFYDLTGCPVSVYDGTAIRLNVPGDPFQLTAFHVKELCKGPWISYVCSNLNLFFARIPVESTELSIVIGPFLMNAITDDYITQVTEEYQIISYPRDVIADYLRTLAGGVFARAMTLVRSAVFFLTQKLLSLDDVFSTDASELRHRINQRHTDTMSFAKEEAQFHNSYNLERMVYAKRQNGEVDFFLNISPMPNYNVGKMAESSLRQAKNTFIVSVALATRAAVAGGLNEETAYSLSDEYIQTVENMVSLDSIDHLSRTMFIDFTERVRDAALPLRDIPEDINRAIQYIRLHTNSDLSVQEVADAVCLSRSHLSHKFKEIMGFDLSSYIMRCKLEEAKSLLTYSQQSIIEISNYLCFSSQSYFTNVFKKKYGMTPKEYRSRFEKKIIL